MDKNKVQAPAAYKIQIKHKDIEKLELLYFSGGKVKWFSNCEKQFSQFLKKLNMKLFLGTATLLLYIYPPKLKTGTQTTSVSSCS